MKTTIASLVLSTLISIPAFATSPQLPAGYIPGFKVSCELSAWKDAGPAGFPIRKTAPLEISKSDTIISQKLAGFKVQGQLRQICAAGFNAPCSAEYELTLSASKNGINSAIFGTVNAKKIGERMALMLDDGKLFLNVICDVEEK